MPYGKALGAYRRINNIRRSAERIAEAQSMINEQKIEAEEKMLNLQTRQGVATAIAQGVTEGASLLGSGLVSSGKISPEKFNLISAGVSGIGSLAGDAIAGRFSIDDETYAGLGQRGTLQALSEMSSPIDAAIHGYAFGDQASRYRRERALRSGLEDAEGNEFGFDERQLDRTAEEIEWQRGEGFDFSNLPMQTAERIYRMNVESGNLTPPEGMFVDPDITRQELMRHFNIRQPQQEQPIIPNQSPPIYGDDDFHNQINMRGFNNGF